MNRRMWERRVPKALVGGVSAAIVLAALALPAVGRTWGPADAPTEPPEPAGTVACGSLPAGPDGPSPVIEPQAVRLFAGMVLAAQETALGIRPDQQEAWRAYTAALIAFIPAGDGVERWIERRESGPGEAFGLADELAGHALERAARAEALRDAIAALRTSLTGAQKEEAARMQQFLVERFLHAVEGYDGIGPRAPL